MRISDWSSDVCSSDLIDVDLAHWELVLDGARLHDRKAFACIDWIELLAIADNRETANFHEVRDRGEFVHLLVREHRAFVENEIDSCQLGFSGSKGFRRRFAFQEFLVSIDEGMRSEEHTSELKSLMRRSNAAFCLKKTIIYKIT